MKYLQTDDRQEQRGRAEDGPVGMKHKWTEWPNMEAKATSSAHAKKRSSPSKHTQTKASPAKTTTSHTSHTGAAKK